MGCAMPKEEQQPPRPEPVTPQQIEDLLKLSAEMLAKMDALRKTAEQLAEAISQNMEARVCVDERRKQ